MSGNQKQPAAGGPQTQRYATSQYQPILTQPPNNYAGSDAYHNPAQNYVQQGQPPNQGPGSLRNIQSSGPPNQASTPPNQDLKVASLPGQLQQMQFVSNPGVRPAQAYFQRGAAGAPAQPQRMPSQHRQAQQATPAQIFAQPPYLMQPVYIQPPTVYYNNQRPPNTMMGPQAYPPHQAVFSPSLAAYQTFSSTTPSGVQAYTHTVPYMYPSQATPMISRASVTPVSAAPANTSAGNPQAAPLLAQPGLPHNMYPGRINAKQRRPNAISIIDPNTGVDKLNEIFDENASQPASGESSARETPQPAPPNKEVQAIFAKQVAQVLNEDRQQQQAAQQAQQQQHTQIVPPHEQPSSLHDPETFHPLQSQQPQSLPAVQQPYDIVRSSLQYDAKEFVSVSSTKPTIKESTPIVSANSDAAEVILSKKDRESPVKSSRKQQPKPVEIPQINKETECDKISSTVVKEEPVPVPQPTLINPVSAEVTSPTETVKESDKKGAKKSSLVEHKSPEPEIPCPTIPSGDATSNNGKLKNRSKTVNNQNGKQQQQPQQHHQQKQPPQQQRVAVEVPPQQQPALQPPPQQVVPQTQPQQVPPQHMAPQTQPATVVVPTTQPPKANNRSNKFKELNMKGANKEGTDMDAFNDNSAGKTEINANVLPTNDISTENDAANANQVAAAEATVVAPPSETDDKKDSNENVTTTIKPEPNSNNVVSPVTATATVPPAATTKPVIKPFDVTSIIKDSAPKSMPPFPIINDNRDETDRASVNEKLVLAKNDVNNKVSNKESTNDDKPQLPYKPGQWAPDKPDGVKVYERDFLLSVKNLPLSQKKPDCSSLPEGVIPDERSRQMDNRLMGGGRTDFTNPPFVNNYGGKSGSQRGTLTKRPSQSGKMGNRAGDKNNSKPLPKVSISLRGDVKLHESENAWKPARFNKVVGETMTEDDKRTESLYKKVRSVLNKLTPQKFDTLVNQVRQLQIDNKDRLQGVIDLVFEKAIDEPSFSLAYAMMCKEIQSMQVSIVEGEKKNLAFRTLLVTRCQIEFEKQSVDESGRVTKVQEMEACTDPEKKKELLFELEESERRLRMRSVGCIRFIGELFKQQMLTASIMRRCLQTLLDNKDEESLECLCKLLTTVGKELESKGVELVSIFDEMKRITDGKRHKVSSRIRFMLQDVIDLRNSKWIPRRGDANPKTMDQIQKEAESEQMNIQVMNMNPQRRDDRGGGGGGGGGGPRRGGGSSQKVNDDGWSAVGSRNNRQQFSIQTDKMRVPKLPMVDEPFGASQQFSNWAKGAGGSKNPQASLNTSNNMYAALENVDIERRPMNSRGNKDPYSSKGPSMERNLYNKSYDGRGGSRSGSQHRDSNTPMRSTGPPPSSMMPSSMAPPQSQAKSQQRYQQRPDTMVQPAAPAPSATPAPQSVPKLSEEQIGRRIRNSLDEFITGCSTTSEYFQDVVSAIEDHSKVVYESYNYILEKSQSARLKTGELFAKLIKEGSISVEDYAKGFEELLGLWEDLVIDIPQIWQYFAEDLVALLLEEVMPFPRLQKLLESLIQANVAKKLLKSLFDLVRKEKGPKFLQTSWQASGMELSSFMLGEDVVPFVQENKFDFLLGGESPVADNSLSFDAIQDRLSEFFKNKASFDDIVNWISANVGDSTKQPKFIRALATAIFEDSISKSKLQNEVLASHNKLIQKYVDTQWDLELQCLYALQALLQKLEHPQGLLLSICDKLYEDSIFSLESFIAWENSTDPSEQEGKGVALKQLTSFFTQLKENDEEEDYSSNSEDA